jgi:methyl-accepting chemotaxis protein
MKLRNPFGSGLAQRMAASFGLVLLLLIGLTAVALHRIDAMSTALYTVSVEAAERGQLLRGLEQHASNHGSTLRTMAAAMASVNEASYAKLDGTLKQTFDGIAKARALVKDDEGLALLTELEKNAKAAGELMAAAKKDAGDRGPAAAAFSARMVYTAALSDWTAKLDKWLESAAKLAAWDTERGRLLAQASAGLGDSARKILVGGALLALVLAAAMGWWLTRNVTLGVAQAVRHAQRMGEHDLSQPIRHTRRDEIGRLLDALEVLRVRQAELAINVVESSRSVLLAAQEISSGSNDLSVRAEQAASILERTVSSINSLAESLELTNGAVRNADELAGLARKDASEGEQVVGSAVAAMSSVSVASRRIADIIGLIDGISFQTNILALNAAVEAARAGEQGRGFAVVASEVRQLAARSAQAAKEIKTLIDASQNEVAKGSEQVTLAGGTTQRIVGSIERVTGIVADISRSAASQLASVGATRNSVRELDSVAQQNAAMAEQASAAALSLTEQATRLTGLVQRFKTSSDRVSDAAAV